MTKIRKVRLIEHLWLKEKAINIGTILCLESFNCSVSESHFILKIGMDLKLIYEGSKENAMV